MDLSQPIQNSAPIPVPKDPVWLGYRVLGRLQSKLDIILGFFFNRQAGGWEGWAQVEIVTMLQEFATQMYILPRHCDKKVFRSASRENNYEDSRLKSDFNIRAYCDEGEEFYGVELKCRSARETPVAFVARIRDDITKLREGQWPSEREELRLVCSLKEGS